MRMKTSEAKIDNMSVLHLDEHIELENICARLLGDPEIRFAGVINKLGNLFAGGFRSDVTPFEDDTKCRMLYMQMVLEITMRKEFDSSLGSIDYIASRRGKGLMITVPFAENVILVSTSQETKIEKIVSKINAAFGLRQSGGNV